ncbi:uncharacterized protein GVI51_I10087 [Nakaseomyces glabratus]|nr:hypothetical protein J7298_02975 [Nakaseomyces glabratus]KAH7585950.1 hypothetical protein J7297_02979 [Nakaseomyces glabratus]KAH7590526.1 hypothetical protein J7296_02780 [Nakaseomyces glabratus]KAH7598778.1 hypothetical protein J7295_02981 [Nakaseomyces glabratus]KAH7599952.1 hypothetical protein J7294_02968 [Nakaseomyces glabratus]
MKLYKPRMQNFKKLLAVLGTTLMISSVYVTLINVYIKADRKEFDMDPIGKSDLWKRDISRNMYDKLPSIKKSDGGSNSFKNGTIPDYVIDNCPLIHLYSDEKYWPSNFSEYVSHFKLLDDEGEAILDQLNSIKELKQSYVRYDEDGASYEVDSEDIFMTSIDDFDKDPGWMKGFKPKYGTGYAAQAPALVFVVDKGNGWVDAFWFYFYPFNWGPFIMGYGPWGNHLGDWEHTLVRFYNGVPKYIWMSAHGGGSAYTYEAIEKKKRLRRIEGRITNELIEKPLLFSARGTHANYPSVGQHSHDVPFFFMPLSDFTDRGPLWDPSLNYYGYTITTNGKLAPATNQTSEDLGTSWLYFQGHWGDKQIPFRDPRQKWCLVQWKYIGGPRGPLRKNLMRKGLCQRSKWWNFMGVCPVRKMIKNGVGLDAERNDYLGDNCGILLYKVRPSIFRSILRLITWRGGLCFLMESFTG